MIFLYRELLLLLLTVPLLVGAYLLLIRRQPGLRYTSLRLVRSAMTTQPFRRHIPPALFLIAFIALLLAAARPVCMVDVLSAQRTIVLAMDVSLSMAATDVAPNRLAASQAAARAFIKAQPSDVRVAIVSFAGAADLVQGPTADRRLLDDAIERLRLDYHTAIGTGIIAALITLFPKAGLERHYDIFGMGRMPEGFRTASLEKTPQDSDDMKPVRPGSYTSAAIVLLTDGSRTMGPDPLMAARMAAARGVRVFTVGFGSAKSARVDVDGWSMNVGFDEESLKQIAAITRGEYFHAGTASALNTIYQDLSSRLVVERRDTEVSALFAAAAALLAVAGGALSILWFPRAL
jgi:Ca-activated chloride channel family protein